MKRYLRSLLLRQIGAYMLIFAITVVLLIPIYTLTYTSARDAMEDSLEEQLRHNLNWLNKELDRKSVV
mgnify:FL=1